MSTPGEWLTSSVPKERCEQKRQQLENDGWEVKPECPEDEADPRYCVLTYRRKYNPPPQ